MATMAKSVTAADAAEPGEPTFFARVRKFLLPPPIGSIPAAQDADLELTLVGRIRKFFWLSSGLFSVASLAIPAIGFLAFGTTEGMGTNFLAAIVSACLFGVASYLHFGPEEA